mmetsp:Transcript_9753/g.24256  ORF Transcript_9753/g.24256 Transcript_9753/m.24256 type:complete len:239 (-) Transcript_9753:80-796(-)
MNAAPPLPSEEQADTMPEPVLPTALPVAMAQPTTFHSVHPPVDIEGPLLVNSGQWADELTDCTKDECVCWATMCWQGIVVAQLAQKVMKVPCLVTIIFINGLTVLYLFNRLGLMGDPFGTVCIGEPCGTTPYGEPDGEPTGFQLSWLSIFLSATINIFIFCMIYHIRGALRNKDRIPGSICEDICLSLPCCCISCCTTCQMMRHVISRSIRRFPDGSLTRANYELCSQEGTSSSDATP